MANSLFGPSPAEVMYARQKELTDQQNRQYEAMLATASTPAERNYMLAGNLLSQAISPLFGAGRQDPMLEKATATQSILSKYGPDAITDPNALNMMAREFATVGMQNEAFQLAQMANELVKNRPDQYISGTGKDLMERFPNRLQGLVPLAPYRLNLSTFKAEPLGKFGEGLGDPGKGFRWEYDQETGTFSAVPTEVTKSGQLKQTSMAMSKVNRMQYLIGDAIKYMYDNPSSTGVSGEFLELFPGVVNAYFPARVTLQGRIDTIKANLGIKELQEMRQANPTGAGVGNVALGEMIRLESTLGNLDLTQGPEEIQRNLVVVAADYDRIRRDIALDPFTAEQAVKFNFMTQEEVDYYRSGKTPDEYRKEKGESGVDAEQRRRSSETSVGKRLKEIEGQ